MKRTAPLRQRPPLRTREIVPVFDRPPETPEGVALALFRQVMLLENGPRVSALDLFHECLMTVRGERRRPGDGAH